MKVWHLKTCDTCRKAIKALREAGHDPELTDVRADGVEAAALDRWMAAVGRERLLNTRSTTWRGLEDADKADLDDARAVALMAAHPTLIKRPVIEAGGAVHVGWTKDVQAALLRPAP